MKARELPLGKAVRVYWRDSAAEHGWKPAEPVEAVVVATLGFVVASDENDLTITHSFTNELGVMCPISIPWVSIFQCNDLPEQYDRNIGQ